MALHKKNILTIGRILLLALFATYYGNITMFYHSHLVDGRVVSHSHWFNHFDNEKPVQSHSHSSEEYILIHFFNHISIDNDVVIPEVANVFRSVHFVETSYYLSAESSTVYLLPQLRAPPVC